jgi:hypothetical protein
MSEFAVVDQLQPRALSEWLELALEDLRKCEQDPRYEIDMSIWHSSRGSVCLVCLGGALMAQTGEVPPERSLFPHDIPDEFARILQAMDYLRLGYIHLALGEVYDSPLILRELRPRCREINLHEEIPDVKVTRYKDSPEDWRTGMDAVLALLKAKGV